MCAIAGRVNLPHFASAIGSPTILLIAVFSFSEVVGLMIGDRACWVGDLFDFHVPCFQTQ